MTLFARLALAIGLVGLATPAPSQIKPGLTDLVEAWLSSPHGNYTSQSFTHWNKDGSVPENCAACHSQPGFIDYLGADGSQAGKVDKPAAINAPIGCASCHTAAAHSLNSVRFPSGVSVGALGRSAVCSVCHQGRASGTDVEKATANTREDTISPKLTFINVHYGVAATVVHGSSVGGGYHYPGRSYAGRFEHVPSANTCVACHDAHTTRVESSGCLSCHRGVKDLRAIRIRHTDFDGDGRIDGGIHSEIAGLHQQLYAAIKAYSAQVSGPPIGYAPGAFPYFFIDSDGDGQIGAKEAVPANRYRSWTPRLLKAAYNYQIVAKDPGGYTHNPTYLLQLLYDSVTSLAARIDIDASRLRRP